MQLIIKQLLNYYRVTALCCGQRNKKLENNATELSDY